MDKPSMRDMTEREIMYRLVGDVEVLKRDVENSAEARRSTREKIDKIETMLQDVTLKLGAISMHEPRFKELEEGVADYRTTKTRLLGGLATLGVLSGSFGATVSTWLTKLLGHP